MEEEIARLFAAPLDQFVTERTELAKRLKAEGRTDEADEVRGLRKPTVAVWAVNQLARRRRQEVERLLEAGERLRAGDAKGADDLNAAIDALLAGTRDVLAEGGHAAADATLQRAAATLRAAAADEEHGRELASGTIREELDPPGFESMLALAAQGRPARAAKPKPDTRQRERARKDLAEAKRRADELRREADRAEREAAQARREADRAEQAVHEAERRLAASDQER